MARQRLSFAATDSWSAWRTSTATVALPAGRNRARLTAIGSSGPNLDALVVRPARQTANLVTNGGFEQGPATADFTEPPNLHLVPSGSSDIPGWRVTRGNVEIIEALWQPAEGKRNLDLDGLTPGTIEQDIATIAGRTYELSFALSGDFMGGADPKALRVSAAGDVAEFSSARPPGWDWPNMLWGSRRWRFVAGSGTTTLRFESLSDPASMWGPTLDAVSVVDITAPS